MHAGHVALAHIGSIVLTCIRYLVHGNGDVFSNALDHSQAPSPPALPMWALEITGAYLVVCVCGCVPMA